MKIKTFQSGRFSWCHFKALINFCKFGFSKLSPVAGGGVGLVPKNAHVGLYERGVVSEPRPLVLGTPEQFDPCETSETCYFRTPSPFVGCHLPHSVLRRRLLYDTPGPKQCICSFREFPQHLPIDMYQVWFPPKMVLWSHLMTYD